MNRRDFIRSMLTGATLSAAGLLLPAAIVAPDADPDELLPMLFDVSIQADGRLIVTATNHGNEPRTCDMLVYRVGGQEDVFYSWRIDDNAVGLTTTGCARRQT
jgi:hypothetical protein